MDDYNYQKTTEAKTQEEKEYYIQQQSKSWEGNRGYSDYAAQIITPGHSVSEQYEFLKNYYDTYKNAKGKKKGLAAKNLRDEIRNKTRFDLDGLFKTDEIFMNEDLRDFLNTSDSGEDYNLTDIRNDPNNWEEKEWYASLCHQSKRDRNHRNIKFVNKDGREAVFMWVNGKYVLSLDDLDKGTYNYARNTNEAGPGTLHGRYDMDPYFRQFGISPIYRTIFGYIYYQSDYGTFKSKIIIQNNSWLDFGR